MPGKYFRHDRILYALDLLAAKVLGLTEMFLKAAVNEFRHCGFTGGCDRGNAAANLWANLVKEAVSLPASGAALSAVDSPASSLLREGDPNDPLLELFVVLDEPARLFHDLAS